MELIPVAQNSNEKLMVKTLSTEKPFIEANTSACTMEEIKNSHIIPVFIKDNEPLISHADFIETTFQVARDIFSSEIILSPNVRLSHPIKGRIPEERNKSAMELEEYEKTIYYERMMFVIEIPSIQGEIDGSKLSLTIGGVKSYNSDNLYSKKGSDEHFKIFIGFKNQVCTNLCVWSDGSVGNLVVRNIGQLQGAIKTLFENYNSNYHLHNLKRFSEFEITENQFAHLIGRSRIYNFLPHALKKDIPQLLFGDSQINTVCRELYTNSDGYMNSINLWNLYNLFTSANKSSYIDSFLERSVNAYEFIEQLKFALVNKSTCWYLN
ncbi:MAG TPA: DUF3871 family protein [Puia sp.]|jgi:hypothetical protein|nr:DUF3871 family protein [Puia sp.]